MSGPATSARVPFREFPEDGAFTTRIAFADGTFVIALYGEFDIAGAPEVERLLDRAEATGASEIVVDLSALHFIDSSGIRVLALAHAHSRRNGHRLSILRGPEVVQRAITLCGLDGLLPFAD